MALGGSHFVSPLYTMERPGRHRNSERKKKSTHGTKKLGRVAQLAVLHNDEVAEEFVRAVEEHDATRYELGVVERAYGGGAFSVNVGGRTVDASLRGILRGRGGFHHNPEATTAVRAGSSVVMDGEQIMAVLSPGQASRARRALGVRSGSGRSSSKGYRFNRSSEERRNAAAKKSKSKSNAWFFF